jgi:DNA-binding transcriptional LysR family regulator
MAAGPEEAVSGRWAERVMAGAKAREWVKRGIELRHFAALQAVAEGGSFSRAATTLGYTQSAVSQQIAALERIVGQQLVHRPGGQRSVTLTEAGALLLEHAQAIGTRLAAAEADLGALADGERGVLRIGSFQAAGARILPRVLRRFLTEAPGVELELTESVTDIEVVDKVERAELDLAFAVEPLRAGPFETRALLLDPFLLMLPAGATVQDLATGATDGRARVPVVCFRSCPSTRIVLTYLRECGIEPDVVLASDQNETLQGAVEAGLGAAVVPRLALDLSNDATEWFELGPDAPARQVSLIWHSQRALPPAAHAFVEVAREVSAEIAAAMRHQDGRMLGQISAVHGG